MAKIVFNRIIKSMSGRNNRVVWVRKKRMSKKFSIDSECYLRKYANSVEHSIIQQNNRKAFYIISSKYQILYKNIPEWSGWYEKANEYTNKYHHTISARSLFYSFFLASWQGFGSGLWLPSDLTPQIDFSFENRFLHFWS